MSGSRPVWDDEKGGDLRSQSKSQNSAQVAEGSFTLEVRRLTSGKGRTVIEIRGLPNNDKWCKTLAKTIKSKLGVGGTYKKGFIEIHGEKLDLVTQVLDSQKIKWKKTGG